ncbi:MAG: hypothetical protein HYR56_25565 [Acidobacteria bacterium]|nr:hypothetical protein [Acidobacteriota bacterium]MBI3423297.1 hypothetical protein [Acidobacteriota bacterium]
MSQKHFFTLTTLLAGISLSLVAWQSINANVPRIWAPFPFWLFLVGMLIPSFLGTKLFILSIPALAMWIWNPYAFLGKPEIPARSFMLFFLLALLSILHNIIYWSYGMKYQGGVHTVAVIILNFSLIATLALIGLKAWRKPAFPLSLGFHWLLFAWFTSYAFPVFGELI